MIGAEKAQFSVKMMCRNLRVSRSGYYAWAKREPSARDRHNAVLLAQIGAIYQQSRATYGSPRIHAELHAQGQHVSRKRVARLMRCHHIVSIRKRRKKRTTNSNHQLQIHENLVKRQFDVPQPNVVWAADLTYIRTAEGWLYLAVVLDLYSRRVVGWSMANRMRTALVLDALNMALARQPHAEGIIHHSDRGSQYASKAFQARLVGHRMRPSMSKGGDAYDNAVVESFFATLKTELVHHCRWKTRQAAKVALFDYIEVFYNRQRRHSKNHFHSPVAFEKERYPVNLQT